MDLVCRGREALLLWDESVWEKPESIALEGLGSVRSVQDARLKRIKKGFYTPSRCGWSSRAGARGRSPGIC